jgi:hypothetical protein
VFGFTAADEAEPGDADDEVGAAAADDAGALGVVAALDNEDADDDEHPARAAAVTTMARPAVPVSTVLRRVI